MKSLSIDERKLLFIQGLDIFAYSLANIFVTVFFFAHSDLKTTALFRAVTFASMTFFLGLSCWSLKRFSSGTLMKSGLFAGALFFFLLFLLGKQSIAWAIPLAILDGFSGGNYWAGYNLNQYILTHSGRRIAYFGWGLAIVNFAQAIGPVIGGFIITFAAATELGIMSGYISLFFLVSVMIALSAIIIGKLPAHEIPQCAYRHLIDHKRTKRWKLILGQQALLGFYDMTLATVTGILLYTIIKQEAQLGATLTIASTMAMISSVLSIRILTNYSWSFWIGSLGTAIAIAFFALYQNSIGVWFFIITSSLTAPFLLNKLSTVYFEALDHSSGTWQYKYHMMIERDVVLGCLRITGYIGLYIFLYFGEEINLARFWLLILPILPLAIGLLLNIQAQLVSHSSPVDGI